VPNIYLKTFDLVVRSSAIRSSDHILSVINLISFVIVAIISVFNLNSTVAKINFVSSKANNYQNNGFKNTS